MYQTKFHEHSLTEQRFLVTGGAGFIGSNLVEYLLKYGAGKVRILDNFSTGSLYNLKDFLGHPALEVMEGDIRNIDDCRQAVIGIDYVSHQAALGSVPRSIDDPLTTNEVNISGFLNMLEVSRNAGIKRFIYAASSSTYGDHPGLPKVEAHIGKPLSTYAVTKYVNELYAQVFSSTYQFHTLGMRYFNVFGPRQNPAGPYAAAVPLFIAAALQGKAPVINGDGETSRDFTFVENAVQANIRAWFKEGLSAAAVVNIAYGERTTLNELWRCISVQENLSIPAAYGAERKGDVKHSLADISMAANLLNYHPEISVLQGLSVALAWYKENAILKLQTESN